VSGGRRPLALAAAFGAASLALASLFVRAEVRAAADRLARPAGPDGAAAAQGPAPTLVADHAEAPYCTPAFKEVLQRVLGACGLVGQQSRRGCQPSDVKTVASISDADFNALFSPLAERGAIVLFDDNSDALDEGAKKALLERWDDRRGARYFFVVARASKTGSVEGNRTLSHKRANSVFFHLQEASSEAELDKRVGMLWLGSEFAQLSKDYCSGWANSRPGKPCGAEAINRSAFVSWVDCRL
jgi:outer membrane protein OmpA-like peptidoglycan-associated protein